MAYHDSELSAGARRRLEKHLGSCDDCRQLLDKLRLADHHASQSEGVNSVVGVPDMPPPDDRYWESFRKHNNINITFTGSKYCNACDVNSFYLAICRLYNGYLCGSTRKRS